MHHNTAILDGEIRELQDKLDETASGIDINSKKKENLNNNIKELIAKKSEIEKILSDYEREYNNIKDKDDELKDYVERRRHLTDDLGEYNIGEINKIFNEESKQLLKYRDDLKNLIDKELPKYKTNLMEAQNNLTAKQKTYEDLKEQLKEYQKEFPTESKKIDDLRKSIDNYIKESELAELYFSFIESEFFSKNLKNHFRDPSKFKYDLLENWKAVKGAMENVNNCEDALKKTQNDIEALKKKLIWLETTRLEIILKRVGELGKCECETSEPYETSKTSKTSETSES